MVTDYEAVLIDLEGVVAGKTQHGREALLVKIAELKVEHKVSAGELERLLRLYGVEVGRARSIAAEIAGPEAPDSVGDAVPAGTPFSPAIIDLGGHDGDGSSSDGRAERDPGRGRGRGAAGRRSRSAVGG